MSITEDLKNKAEEVDLQAKAKDLGDAVAEVVKAAFGAVAEYAQTNREKVDQAFDKAEHLIDDRTGGKHAETVGKVRSQLDKGMDKLSEKGSKSATSPDSVPNDRHSAFDEDFPAGSPS